MPADELPVRGLEQALLAALRDCGRAVLAAPTGSGKTTLVPQMLLAAGGWPGQIVVLQPRRLAARLVARRVAQQLQVPLGGLVGYQTRYERVVSPATRIRFVTDGLFLRQCQAEPRLADVAVVVIDEFHERSLAADLALGWVRRLQATLRPELRLVVMSATLPTQRLGAALACPVLATAGRAFPIAVSYRPAARREPPWDQAAAALVELLASGAEGDVLVFMPGQYEIARTLAAAAAATARLPAPPLLLPLHGGLPAAAQDAAVGPAPGRKVIVATNVAETSITIPGVRHVIDAGLARVLRHDQRRGIDTLHTEPISIAAAEQRAGRAGRTACGTCVRLWSAAEHSRRPAHDTPEVKRVDLAGAMLLLAALGERDVEAFLWLDPPDPHAVARARELLRDLGALDPAGALTPIGHQLAALPLHPRLGRLLLAARQRHCVRRAALWAAMLGERDLLAGAARARQAHSPASAYPSDLEVREQAFLAARAAGFAPAACQQLGVRAEVCRQVNHAWQQYLQAVGARAARALGPPARDAGGGRPAAARGARARAAAATPAAAAPDAAGTGPLLECLLVAYFDRVAIRRGPDTLLCAMAGQRRVELDARSVASHSQAVVAADVREVSDGCQRVRTVLSLASAIDLAWLESVHPDRIQARAVTSWNAAEAAVEQHEEWLYDGLVYRRERAARVDPQAAAPLLVERILAGEVRLDRWDEQVEQWLWRTRLVARLFPERSLPTYDAEQLAGVLRQIVAGATRAAHLRGRPCLAPVRAALSAAQQQFVERMAPTRLPLPGGAQLRVEYRPDQPPRGRAQIQQLYGLTRTPSIAAGRQPLLLEILGPHLRPLQVTDDLASFWRTTYPALRPELRRRYPRHEWR